jgi:putative ABC transport system substrate-binding protein
MMKRRAFIMAVAAGLVMAPLTLSAQPAGKVWRIGFLGNASPTTPDTERIGDAFRQELQECGYVEGRNLVIERRFIEGDPQKAPGLAADLVRLRVDLIVTVSNQAAQAAKAATSTTPIVMLSSSDPVGAGLVASLARPGGNLTGVSDYGLELTPKRLELLKAALPRASRVAVTKCQKCAAVDDRTLELARQNYNAWAATAQNLGMTLTYVDLSGPQGFDGATAEVLRARPDALFVGVNSAGFALRKELADFAIRERIPMFAFAREQAALGALMSYGIDYADLFHKAAVQIDKIFKGAKPADLPIEQPTKFELVINLKTARALGITIPQDLRLRADEVIQ